MSLSFGAKIGVIGGGQLGRMLILECRRMGYETAVIDPDLQGPAAQVANRSFRPEQWREFLGASQVATYEFEHVDLDMVQEIARRLLVRPDVAVLAIKRSRTSEKTYLAAKGFPVPRFQIFSRPEDITPEKVQLPLVIKTAGGGYDGKGLFLVKTREELLFAVKQLTGEVIVEELVEYAKEISVMCARDGRGNISLYPPVENVHHQGILLYTLAPAAITEKERALAHEIAAGLAETLGLVGLVGIEMFLLPKGDIMINEFAPRPHNSGHYSMDGCNISQFEMLLRAIADLPLEKVELLSPTAMLNIIGYAPAELPWGEIFSLTGVKLHLYGKQEPRRRRKMGHFNILAKTRAELTEKLKILQSLVYPPAQSWRIDVG